MSLRLNQILGGADIRSPIFYDVNNTSYYIDPASTTNLNDLYLDGDLRMNGSDSYIWMPNNNSYSTGFYDPVTGLTPLQLSGPSDGIYIGNTMWISYNKSNVNGYNENIRLFNANNSVSVIAFSSTGISGTPTTSILGYSDRFETRVSDQWQQRIYSGYVEAYGSFRAPIFYDSNNTNYYVDPASTSLLNATRSLSVVAGSNSAMTGSPGSLAVYSASSPYISFHDGGVARTAYFQEAGGRFYFGDVPYTESEGSFRAPLFYDVNDTNYYVDPASTSVMLYVRAANFHDSTGSYNVNLGSGNSEGRGLVAGYSGGSYGGIGYNVRHTTTGGSWIAPSTDTSTYLLFSNGIYFYYAAGGAAGRTLSYSTIGSLTSAGIFTVSGDVRAPLFYDSSNTAYYLDPASTSNLNVLNAVSSTTLWVRSGSWAGDLTSNGFTREIGMQMTGGSEFVILSKSGQGYTLVDGSYYAYEAGGFYSSFNSSYGAIVGFSADSTTSVTFNCNVKAPIFYDSANTAYYVDPASTSNLNAITAAGNITAAQYYTGGWFRNNGSGNGLYNESTGQHFYSDSANYWNVASSAGAQGIRLRTGGYNGTVRGYFYADTNNDVGFLNQDGNWRLRVVGGDYALADGSSMRAQIFYDSNNTAFYIDAASTSNLNVLNIAEGNLELYKSQTVDMSNTTTYSTSNYYPVTIPVPTEGCIIQIQNNLNSNVPSWATHGSGFTLNLKWRTNGFGWGTTQVRRIIDQYFEQFTNQTICGGITQMGNSSTEVVWLRGGGQYYFKFSRNLSATAQSATYTVSSQSVSPTSTAQNTIWSSAGGSSIQYNDQTISTTNMYTPVLYDWNNSAYFVDPASTSNLVGLTVANTISGSINGTANGLNSSNYISRVGSSGNYNTDFQNTPAGTVRHLGDDASATNNPGGTWWFVDNYRHSNGSNYWGTQVAWGWEDQANKLATRNITGGTFGSWVYYLNSGNYSSYAIARGGDTVDGITLFRSNKGATSTVGSSNTYALQAFSSDAGAAGMSFHRGGYYAVNMGLDPDNVFRIGGWSASANRLQLDMSGNLTVAGAMYGTNFIDSDNTAYFCNPASTSNLVGLTVANTITGAVSGNAGSVTINYNNDSNSTYQMLWGSGNNVYGTAGVYLNPSTDVLYANAFYDAGNTAYYLDPNSTSNLLLVKTRNTFGERIAVTAASSTTIDTQYNVTELTMSTNVSLTLSNIQSSGTVHMWTIVTVGNGTAYSIGWPAAIKWPGGTAPTITSTNTKRDIYQFVTYDGGTTIYAIIVGQNL